VKIRTAVTSHLCSSFNINIFTIDVSNEFIPPGPIAIVLKIKSLIERYKNCLEKVTEFPQLRKVNLRNLSPRETDFQIYVQTTWLMLSFALNSLSFVTARSTQKNWYPGTSHLSSQGPVRKQTPKFVFLSVSQKHIHRAQATIKMVKYLRVNLLMHCRMHTYHAF
jgi:hypothetical protein